MNRPVTVVLVCLVLSAVSWSASAAEAFPQVMSFQGFLTDGAGHPITGERNVFFGIYAEPDGGTPLWTQEAKVVMRDGVFTAVLGTEGSPLSPEVLSTSARYLGMQIEGDDQELLPRQVIGQVPFASHAEVSERLADTAGLFSAIAADGFLKSESDPGVNALGKSELSCEAGQIPKLQTDGWACVQDSDSLAAVSCAAGDVVVFDGKSWECVPMPFAAEGGGLVAWVDGGLSLSMDCGDGESLKFAESTGSWSCAKEPELPEVNSLATAKLACGLADIPKYDGKQWACSPDNGEVYSAGQGLSFNEGVFALDVSFTDPRYLQPGQSGVVDSAMIKNSSILPEDLAGSYSASDHNHDGKYSATEHLHAGVYAPAVHKHEGVYALIAHDHGDRYLTPAKADLAYAAKVHTHGPADITGNVALTTASQTFSGKNDFSGGVVFSAVTGPEFNCKGAPFSVVSNTVVTNLNADLIDGKAATDFAASVHEHDVLYVKRDEELSVSAAMIKHSGIKWSIPAMSAAFVETSGVCNLERAVAPGMISQGASVFMTRDSTGTCNYYFPLVMPIIHNDRPVMVESVDICYKVDTSLTFITATNVYSEDTGNVSVLVTDNTDLVNISPVCYTVAIGKVLNVSRALTLRLSTVHSTATDRIYISHFNVKLLD